MKGFRRPPRWLPLVTPVAALLASAPLPRVADPEHVQSVYQRLLAASELVDAGTGRVVLSSADLARARADMHLQPRSEDVPAEPPGAFLPAEVLAEDPVDVTELVLDTLPEVLAVHPAFLFMAEQTVGNDAFHESVYFGTAVRDEHSLAFPALCRRFVASIYLFETLLALGDGSHRALAHWYESLYLEGSTGERSRPFSVRDALMGFFLALKGESVLASINAFEELRRLDRAGEATGVALRSLSDVLNAIMRLNICEAVLSNLSFAFWPDNARAGMALLLAPLGAFRAGGQQDLSPEWLRLYLAWNANFIWPSHYCPDMMCFTMLAMPSLALGPPEQFQYRRAHTLFWVVRSTQITRRMCGAERVARAAAFGVPASEFERPPAEQQVPCFHCRQLEPRSDRQPLTSRTAKLTRAEGEVLARACGGDVGEGSGVWRRLALEVVPEQITSLTRVYSRMPKRGLAKLRLL